jgi:hypothetical protein
MLGMGPKEADKLCRDAVAATKDRSLHSYAPQYVSKYSPLARLFHGRLGLTMFLSYIAYGRKPEA